MISKPRFLETTIISPFTLSYPLKRQVGKKFWNIEKMLDYASALCMQSALNEAPLRICWYASKIFVQLWPASSKESEPKIPFLEKLERFRGQICLVADSAGMSIKIISWRVSTSLSLRSVSRKKTMTNKSKKISIQYFYKKEAQTKLTLLPSFSEWSSERYFLIHRFDRKWNFIAMWGISRFDIQIFHDKVWNIQRSSYLFFDKVASYPFSKLIRLFFASMFFVSARLIAFFVMTSTIASTTKIPRSFSCEFSKLVAWFFFSRII